MEPIGACLMNHLDAWRKNGAEELVKQGIWVEWASHQSVKWLQNNIYELLQTNYYQQMTVLEFLINNELQKVIVEKGKERWRKIMDCSEVNKHLVFQYFKMDDIQTLRQLARNQDWAIKLDLESAYNHVPVSRNLCRYLGFQFKDKFCMYHAMCFGIKNAPLVFHKLMKPVMQYTSTSLHIRCLSYSDDLVFLNNSIEDLQQQIPKILEIFADLCRKISREKSILTPYQQIEFLGWKVDLKNSQLLMTRKRKAETLCMIGKWRRTIEKNQFVRIKWVASLIGKLNFLSTQFRRGDDQRNGYLIKVG
ncbi:MAG: putative reverse transcriptase [Streblomastix strix]|uniref:Putative reverse transcriptase n=1 Tax=Streblomastix strix TaxID=222440 RepID=A0A5J4UPX2_9EUKA|nr:MAG: putative reverse transcriptase [Streblomastix strix]